MGETTKELQKVKRLLKKSNSVPLYYTINHYLDGKSEAKFNSKRFFEEVKESGVEDETAEAIEDFYQNRSYPEFKSAMLEINDEIIKEKIQNPKTSYKQITYLVDFVSTTYLKNIVDHNFDADDISGSKKLRFALVYKSLEPIFLCSISGISDSDFTEAKAIFTNYCCEPSEVLMDYINGKTSKPFEPFDSEGIWLMKHIIKSL